MRKFIKVMMTALIVAAFAVGFSKTVVSADGSDSINEKLGQPILIYGAQLTDAQRATVRELVGVEDGDNVQEFDVTGADAAEYINGNPNSNMYSSAKITQLDDGSGLMIDIVTPDNITAVTSEMYANALLTAGVEDAEVEVASPVKVSGHSALTGIYKAYDVQGNKLDKDRMEVANEELDVATDLVGKDGLTQEDVSNLLTEIKQAIAEKNPVTREDVEEIIDNKLSDLNIDLSDADRQHLIDLFNKIKDLDIDFGKVKDQLKDIASDIKDRISDIAGDQGFWEKVGQFFSDLFSGIGDFFKNLFG